LDEPSTLGNALVGLPSSTADRTVAEAEHIERITKEVAMLMSTLLPQT